MNKFEEKDRRQQIEFIANQFRIEIETRAQFVFETKLQERLVKEINSSITLPQSLLESIILTCKDAYVTGALFGVSVLLEKMDPTLGKKG